MNSLEIANLLRVIADVIESDAKVARAIETHLAKSPAPEPTKSKSKRKKTSSEALLSECRQILREQGEEKLRTYLVELGEQVRELLKHGQLDPNRSIRRRQNLNSIIEHIIQKLQEQDKSGTVIASAIVSTE